MKLRWKVILSLAFLCLLGGFALYVYQTRTESRYEAYKKELIARGEKLSLGDLVPPLTNTPPDITPFLDAVADLSRNSFPAAKIEWNSYIAAGEIGPLSRRQELHGTTEDWNSLRKNRERLGTTLQIIRDFVALSPSRPDSDFESIDSAHVSYFKERRLAMQWLAASCLSSLHEGKEDDAFQDLTAILFLARMHHADPTLINQMVRSAILNVALSVTRDALSVTEWDDSKLLRLHLELEQHDPLAGLEVGITWERNIGTRVFDLLKEDASHYGTTFRRFTSANASRLNGDRIALELWRRTIAEQDQLFHLQFMQETVENVRSLRQLQNLQETRKMAEQQHMYLEQALSSWNRFKHLISSLTILNFSNAIQNVARTESERRMTLIAIAIKRFQLRNGALPTTLDALVPELLSVNPIDLMSGKQFCYRVNADETYTLYSVGDDGADNGGDPTTIVTNETYYLWSGRDAVWPKVSDQ